MVFLPDEMKFSNLNGEHTPVLPYIIHEPISRRGGSRTAQANPSYNRSTRQLPRMSLKAALIIPVLSWDEPPLQEL
jgi:hypothetical protein